MFGAFEDVLKYRANGWLEVCGPLGWDDPVGPQDVQSVTVSVAITQDQGQNQVVATGMSPTEFARGDDEWMFFVRPAPGDKFVDGSARALGLLVVTDPPTLESWLWWTNPTLAPRPPESATGAVHHVEGS
jgi:hypothetical protein